MAPRSTPLRAVKEGEQAKVKRLSVSEAAASGDRRALLVAMRDRIAVAVANPDCPPRDLAALTRRLADVAKEIEAIDVREVEEGEAAGASVGDEEWTAI